MDAQAVIEQTGVEMFLETPSRCASDVEIDDLEDMRKKFEVLPKVKDADNGLDDIIKPEGVWDGQYEVEIAAEHVKRIKNWAQVEGGLEWRLKDARRHDVDLRTSPPSSTLRIHAIYGAVLVLRKYRLEPHYGAFLGIEIRRGLTNQGLHQAEAEFYPWARYDQFPFVQLITDMQTGAIAFYCTGSSPGETHLVQEVIKGMDAVTSFVQAVAASIPHDAGCDGPDNRLVFPTKLENPARKRLQDPGLRGPPDYKRAFELIVKFKQLMEPDVGNELLDDLDDFDELAGADGEDADAGGVNPMS